MSASREQARRTTLRATSVVGGGLLIAALLQLGGGGPAAAAMQTVQGSVPREAGEAGRDHGDQCPQAVIPHHCLDMPLGLHHARDEIVAPGE